MSCQFVEKEPSYAGFNNDMDKLSKGMSGAEVEAILGKPYISTNPNSLGRCDSYIYNHFIDAQFIHFHYSQGNLFSMTDDHNAVCMVQ